MRSVVVVLPASMCAMMPMLRSLARAASAAATVIPTSTRRCSLANGWSSPAVVREGLVGLRHLVGVLAALHRGTQSVARVEQLVHQPLDHRLFAPRLGVRDEPAQPERGGAGRPHLDRYLVGGATDTAAAHLEGRLPAVPRP